MFQSFKPINDNVLVQLIEKEKTTTGGIIIPHEAQEKSQQALVIHAGKSEQLVAGDKVFFKKYFGINLDDKFVVLKEEEILGVMHV
jgi:co-chaperonin GroES (HSP10)